MANKNFIVKNNLEISGGTIEGPATLNIDPAAVGDNTGTLVVKGNLQVDGTQTTINSTTLTVDDKKITVAEGAGSSSAADEAGIEVGVGAVGASSNPSILYEHDDTSWNFNKPVNVTGAFSSSGAITAGSDTNTVSVFGRTAIGFVSGLSDYAMISHYDRQSSSNYALLQSASGSTYLNGTDVNLSIGGTRKVVVDSNGKVLIGDTASHTSDFLQIETPDSGGGHGIQIRRNSANNDQGIGHILFGNNTATDLVKISAKTDLDSNAGDSGALLFHTQVTSGNLTERMRIDSDGKVGIGTTSPSRLVTINSTGQTDVTIRSGNSDYSQLMFGDQSADNRGGVLYNNADEKMHFNTTTTGSGDNHMTIDGVGKVGINDTSPSYTLDVDGDINFTGSLREDGTALNMASLYSYNIEYLVIAGGGQGGDQHGGGGGAGGYRNSYASETSGRGSSGETAITTATGVTYTCTVGAGATTSHPGSGQDGVDGSNSSLAGSGITTITSTGGGGGAGHHDGGTSPRNGGCGGGSGLTGTGGDGVAAQGYDGGDNQGSGYSSWPNCGSGGGGAGAAGGDGDANSNGNANGWGGTGLASSITGSSVVRGGGGGGGSHAPHTPATGSANLGAAGGGGTGGLGNSTSTNATSGVDAKGGGGGGSNGAGQTCGGGGDGIVILRMPTASYSGTTTGSPTVTTSGSDTILSFTGTGTYTS